MKDYKITLNSLFDGRLKLLERKRLIAEFPFLNDESVETNNLKSIQKYHFLNDLVLHKSQYNLPHMPNFEFSLGNDISFPPIQADGFIVSTSTGSTGYSLSTNNGPIIYPTLSNILLNVINCRTLSFRPLILPNCIDLKISLGDNCKLNSVAMSIDGISRWALEKNNFIKISPSNNHVPIYSLMSTSLDWNLKLTKSLQWSKPLVNNLSFF